MQGKIDIKNIGKLLLKALNIFWRIPAAIFAAPTSLLLLMSCAMMLIFFSSFDGLLFIIIALATVGLMWYSILSWKINIVAIVLSGLLLVVCYYSYELSPAVRHMVNMNEYLDTGEVAEGMVIGMDAPMTKELCENKNHSWHDKGRVKYCRP